MSEAFELSSPVERFVEALNKQYIRPMDRALLDLVFAEHPTQEDLDACLRVCDIEVLGAHKVLMLSYLLHERPELKVSGYAGPRIKSMINYFRFANMKVLAHFSKIGKAINAADIPFAIFKGGAMKALRPEFSRPMGDVDMLLKPEHMAEAVRICEGLGYHDGNTGATHAVDMFTADGKYAVDMHHDVFGYGHESREFHEKLFARAEERAAFGVRLLLPAHEDLLFISLANLLKNLRLKTSIHGMFHALRDYRFLLADKADFNWAIVRENAELTGLTTQITLAVAFANKLVPGLLPQAEKYFSITEKESEFCRLYLIDDEYYRNGYKGVQHDLAAAMRRESARRTPFHAVYENRDSFPDAIRQHLRDRAFEVNNAY